MKNFDSDIIRKNLMIAFAIVVCAFGRLSEVNAQYQNPAISVSQGKVMIGKSDLNPNGQISYPNHILTFGQSWTETFLPGLTYQYTWYIAKEADGLNFGRKSVFGGLSSSNRDILIRSDGNVGIGMSSFLLPSYKLDVKGLISSSNGVCVGSDRRYKRDIKPLNNLDNLFKVNSVQYKSSGEALKEQLELFKQENKNLNENDFNSIIADYERKIAEQEADTKTYFGFIAQELREVFPELVYEDTQGFLSVNYTGLIPVLVDALKEHNSEIKELKSEIAALKGGFEKQSTEFVSSAKLYQNNPNPFDKSTGIKYYVPNDANNVSICIYDLTGLQLLKVDITIKGYSSIHLNANQFRAGMYLYSLLVDGLEVDTKKMVITD